MIPCRPQHCQGDGSLAVATVWKAAGRPAAALLPPPADSRWLRCAAVARTPASASYHSARRYPQSKEWRGLDIPPSPAPRVDMNVVVVTHLLGGRDAASGGLCVVHEGQLYIS